MRPRWLVPVVAAVMVGACSGQEASPSRPASTPTPTTAAPSIEPTLASSPAPVGFSLPRAALRAVRRFELALIAAETAGEIDTTEYRPFEPNLNILRLSLGDGSVPLALTDYAGLSTLMAADTAKLSGPFGKIAVREFTLLGSVLNATAMAIGGLPTGSSYTTTFSPGIVLTLPAGWSATAERATKLTVTNGTISIIVDRSATAATPEALDADLLVLTGSKSSPGPTAFQAGDVPGWTGSVAKAGMTARAWVLATNHAPLSVVASGPDPAMASAAGELELIVAQLIAP